MIPGDIIVKGFKKTGISNRLDGTEDNLLWDHEDKDAASDIEDAASQITELSDS